MRTNTEERTTWDGKSQRWATAEFLDVLRNDGRLRLKDDDSDKPAKPTGVPKKPKEDGGEPRTIRSDMRKIEKMLNQLFDGSGGRNIRDELLKAYESQQCEIQDLQSRVNEATKPSKRRTHEELVAECNESGKTMTTKTYRDRIFPPMREDQEVCHIYAEANGGANHPSNYIPGDKKANRSCSNNNDSYYAALVGLARTSEAYKKSKELRPDTSLVDPEILYKVGVDHIKQNTKVQERDVEWFKLKASKKESTNTDTSEDEVEVEGSTDTDTSEDEVEVKEKVWEGAKYYVDYYGTIWDLEEGTDIGKWDDEKGPKLD